MLRPGGRRGAVWVFGSLQFWRCARYRTEPPLEFGAAGSWEARGHSGLRQEP